MNQFNIYFNNKPIRTTVSEDQTIFYSAVDIISIIAKPNSPRRYWNNLKCRNPELSSFCRQLKLFSNDHKKYFSDVIDSDGIPHLLVCFPPKYRNVLFELIKLIRLSSGNNKKESFNIFDELDPNVIVEQTKHVIYPNSQFKSFCYIKSVITRPNIIVGDYSYYDDSEDGPESFEKHVTHNYDFMGDKLIIGKFVALARGVEFVMNGANHMLDCLTTYPFEIIDEFKGLSRPFGDRGNRGDTVVGNDVWIGQKATILPGVHIGDGAVIGANTVVAKDVPPYAVVVGNPAVVKKYRFDKETIDLLLELKWWDKDIEEIKKLIPLLTGDIEQSKKELRALLKK